MSLQAKLDAFKADFEAGKPPYSVPRSVIETMHRAHRRADRLRRCAARPRKPARWLRPSR